MTAKAQFNLHNAKEYFEEHLCVGDYYQEGERVAGEWFGTGAERLGLAGKVTAKGFTALCDNLHPETGKRLTQRLKGLRQEAGGTAANRRIFYDFTISPPKSVSILALAGGDERIIEAHECSIRIALAELETFAATRVRQAGANNDRLTGNLVTATFRHDTSRALDPHLHTHCIVFNTTFDGTERRWKALQNFEMLRARKFIENVYYHELTRSLRSFGYDIKNHPRGDFEVEGISNELRERFSKRHAQIDEGLKALLKNKPDLASANLKDLREQVAVTERPKKVRDKSREQLRVMWQSQLSSQEQTQLDELVSRADASLEPVTNAIAQESLEWAEKHLFDRKAVVLEHDLWRHALEHGRGHAIDLASLKRLTRQRGYFRDSSSVQSVTSREVLVREWEIVCAAKAGIGAYAPLADTAASISSKLDAEQQTALKRLLVNRDFVMLFRGGAGTGKSFVLRELVSHLQTAGRSVCVVAPQRQQVVDLAKAEFPAPTTVTDFLLRQRMPERGIVLVDEAGQIGGRQMLELVRLVRSHNGRLVLSGDTRQHGPVEVSDAMVALEKYAGLKAAELHTIKRQNPAQGRTPQERAAILEYRKAVEAAADQRLKESFVRLDRMGAVTECRPDEQQQHLAEEYVRLAESENSVVVISQTWAEVHRVNERVRAALKAKGLLGESDMRVETLEKADLTNAQKHDERYYDERSVVVFNRKVQGVNPGASAKFVAVTKHGVVVEADGKLVTVLKKHLDKIAICQPRELALAAGERLQMKANRRLSAGSTVTNGELVTVASVRTDGTIELTDGRVLDTNCREFVPGYAVTSYGSQGKTLDYVLFSDSTIKAATNNQQWYVTISRGRKGIRIFTPDKAQLCENVVRAGQRTLALDLAGIPSRSRVINRLPAWARRVLKASRLYCRFHTFDIEQTKSYEHKTS
jgi:conjugative relaxase-like TrwC/TraI family protein